MGTRTLIDDKFLESVSEVIKELGPITANDLSNYLGCSKPTVSRSVSILRDRGLNIRSTHNGYVFCGINMKNSEGYPDPTASIAISGLADTMMNNRFNEKVEKHENLDLSPGSVIAKDLEDKTFLNIIISNYGPYIYCFPLVKYSRTNFVLNKDFVVIDSNNYADTRKIITLNVKNEPLRNEHILFEKDVDVSSIANQLKSVLMNRLIGDINLDDKEYQLLKQRAEIYEKAFYAVCGKFKDED